MTSTDTADPADVTDTDVEHAEKEADEAAALVDALEERVRDGDDTVGPDEIDQARKLGAFARLRAQATRRKVEKAKEQASRQARDAARARILDLADGDHPTNTAALERLFADTRDSIRTALATLLEAAETRNALISDAAKQARAVGLSGDAHGVGPYGMRGGVMVDGLGRPVLDLIEPERVLAAALWEAVVALGMRRQAAPWSELARPTNPVAWRGVIGRDLEA